MTCTLEVIWWSFFWEIQIVLNNIYIVLLESMMILEWYFFVLFSLYKGFKEFVLNIFIQNWCATYIAPFAVLLLSIYVNTDQSLKVWHIVGAYVYFDIHIFKC